MKITTAIKKTRKAKQAGSAMVELALVSSMLIMFLAGGMDFGRLFYATTALSAAAEAGAAYGVQSTTTAVDYTGMQNAAIAAAPNLTGVTSTATQFCECSDNTSVSCAGSCATGTMKTYLRVSVSGNYSMLSSYMFFNASMPITAAVNMRFS